MEGETTIVPSSPTTKQPKKRTKKTVAPVVTATDGVVEEEHVGTSATTEQQTMEERTPTTEDTKKKKTTGGGKRASGKKSNLSPSEGEEQPTPLPAKKEDPQEEAEGEEDGKSRKRGRKPKGGKIIQQVVVPPPVQEPKKNIILHLKCTLRDLTAVHSEPVESYDLNMRSAMAFETVPGTLFDTKLTSVDPDNSDSDSAALPPHQAYRIAENAKEIWRKLKILEHNLHFNNLCDKKSACFWCTYNFQNPAVHIPKHFLNGSYHVYGCFCSPECAAAFLMEENLDSSTRFERYYLLNHVYKKVYDYNKNIKPAPNPYYTLDKFYGNLNIHEYRALLRNERLFLVVDKPLTKVMPELHEENDDMMMNNKIIPNNTVPVKKQVQKKPFSKLSVLSEKFGLQG